MRTGSAPRSSYGVGEYVHDRTSAYLNEFKDWFFGGGANNNNKPVDSTVKSAGGGNDWSTLLGGSPETRKMLVTLSLWGSGESLGISPPPSTEGLNLYHSQWFNLANC